MTNDGYGSIDYIDRPFNVETFIEDIDTSVKENNSQLVIIDYLQLIGSEKDLDERRRIAEAYRVLLAYCHRENVAVLTPAQYKQSTFDELIKSTDVGNFDLRTAGGGSAEVLRTPDISFALWATTADLTNNRMKILSMPCRLGKAYPKIDVIHDGWLIYPCGDLTSKIFDFTGFYRLVVSLCDSLVLWLCGSVLWLVRCLC